MTLINPGLRQNCFARAPELVVEIITPAQIEAARARLHCAIATRNFVRRVVSVRSAAAVAALLGGDVATVTAMCDADVVAALFALADLGEGV